MIEVRSEEDVTTLLDLVDAGNDGDCVRTSDPERCGWH